MTRKLAAALVLSLLPIAAWAAEGRSDAEPQANVKVTFRLGKLEQGKRTVVKTYDLVVAAESSGSKLLSGSRIAMPTGGTDIVDQNIGFSAEAMVWIVAPGKIKLQAKLEDSRLVERVAGQAPQVETRQLSVNAVLAEGKPMEVTRVDSSIDPSGFVEVEASILK